jgi:ankyrin repeat protein
MPDGINRSEADTTAGKALVRQNSGGRSLTEERRQAFSAPVSSPSLSSPVAAATSASSSSSAGRTYRVPSVPARTFSNDADAVSVSSTASLDSNRGSGDDGDVTKPLTLADRMQSYQRKASSSNLNVEVPISSPKPSVGSPSVINEYGNFNLHGGPVSLDDIDNELKANPGRLDERDSNSRTPLLAACFGRKWDTAKYFVEKGADVSVKDRFGATALIFAAMCGQLEMCELLISRGADPYLKNNIGRNALSFITSPDTKSRLIASLPEGQRRADEGTDPARTVTRQPSSLMIERKHGLPSPGNVSSPNVSSPASSSVAGSSVPGRAHRVPSVPSTSHHSAGSPSSASSADSSSMAASEEVKPVSLAERMQSYQRKASSSDVFSSSGAFSPSLNNAGSAASPLTPNEAVRRIEAVDGMPSLHSGLLSFESLDAELEMHPERLNEKDANGRTPLLASCFSKNWDMAKYFVEKGADVTAKDRFGATALIFSAMCGRLETCLLLVSRGADPYMKNSIGRDALSFVTNLEHKNLLIASIPDHMRRYEDAATVNSTASGQPRSAGSLVSQRQQSFSGGSSNRKPATEMSAPSSSVRSYRVPSIPSSGVTTSTTSVSRDPNDVTHSPVDTQGKRPMADRLESYQRTASTSVQSPSNAAGSPASGASAVSPMISGRSGSVESAIPNLHNGLLSVEQMNSVLEAQPNRLDERDSNGRTPLLACCFAKKWDIARYFIGRGADVTVKDRFGATALIFAAMCGQVDVCELLVSNGADLYQKNNVINYVISSGT